MFNVTVLDGKKLLRYISLIVAVIIVAVCLKLMKNNKKETVKQVLETATQEVYSHSYLNAMDTSIASMRYLNKSNNQDKHEISFISSILNSELGISNRIIAKSIDDIVDNDIVNEDENQEQINSEIPDNIVTQVVEDKNMKATYTNTYENVEIKNKSGYNLSLEDLTPNISLENKRDIIIFHTHTCESYTPSDRFTYQMTGNYRTTDLNYTVARVGNDLTEILKTKGYNVIHNTTLHDFPSYSGSYANSMETVKNVLNETKAQLIIDLHRDAVGDGTTYGPKVKINDETVAQLMIVVGTDAGGLEHPNWKENLKFAVKLQQKANELYPGLFRPINLSTARYNQNLSKGAIIIEVGATANTMEECLASMKYFASVIDGVMRE